MQFTEPTSPIYIDFNTDTSDSEFLFVISTTQSVYDSSSPSKKPGALDLRKRGREDSQNTDSSRDDGDAVRLAKKRSVRAATTQHTDNHGNNNTNNTASASSQRPDLQGSSGDHNAPSQSGAPEQLDGPEPLFMPGASQLSNADLDILRSSGLGIEHMNYEEFEAMMAAEGEEVGMSPAIGNGNKINDDTETVSRREREDFVMDSDEELLPTQPPVAEKGAKVIGFQHLSYAYC